MQLGAEILSINAFIARNVVALRRDPRGNVSRRMGKADRYRRRTVTRSKVPFIAVTVADLTAAAGQCYFAEWTWRRAGGTAVPAARWEDPVRVAPRGAK